MKCEWTLNIDNDKTITFNSIEELENYIIKNNPEYITYAGTKYNFEEITKSLQEIKNESSSNTSGVLKVINKIPGLIQGFNEKAYEEGFKRITLEELTKKGVNEIQRDLELKKLWTAKKAEIKNQQVDFSSSTYSNDEIIVSDKDRIVNIDINKIKSNPSTFLKNDKNIIPIKNPNQILKYFLFLIVTPIADINNIIVQNGYLNR